MEKDAQGISVATSIEFLPLISIQTAYSHLLPPTYRQEVVGWLKDDCPSTDIGGFVVGEKTEVANLYCKTSGVLAGVPFAQTVFDHLELTVKWLISEGEYVDIDRDPSKKIIIATVTGKCRHILLAERTALNLLARASGVATEAYKAVQIAKHAGWNGYVAGTRKTTPGFKMVEKYALVVGGAATHRQDLSQMVMLKDNHIWSAGSITAAGMYFCHCTTPITSYSSSSPCLFSPSISLFHDSNKSSKSSRI